MYAVAAFRLNVNGQLASTSGVVLFFIDFGIWR
jgi:hypothetical protein